MATIQSQALLPDLPPIKIHKDFEAPFARYNRPWVYDKQRFAIFSPVDCHGLPARYSLIEASTKTGKTTGCIVWLFEQAIQGRRGDNYWWVAPVYSQCKIAWERMKRAIPARVGAKSNESDLTITIPGGRKIYFKTGEKPDNLYGEDVRAVVVDEASRTRPEVWYAIRSTLTATRGAARIIGNVKGRKNWFFDMARRAEKGETGMSYHKMIAHDAVQAGVLSAEEIEGARRDLPEHVFKELYLAEPSDDGGNPFGRVAQIEACIAPLSRGRVVAWGWDLAKSIDWTVGVGLDTDGNVAAFERFQLPWPVTIQRIREATGNTPALVDSTGVGDPVLEQLQQEFGSSYEGFKYNPGSKQQLMEGLAVAIQQGAVHYPKGPISIELLSFEYQYTRTGVRYGAPEGEHDDCVCALAQAVLCKGNNRDMEVWRALGRKR